MSVGEAVVMSVASTDSTAGTSSSRKRKLLVTAKVRDAWVDQKYFLCYGWPICYGQKWSCLLL